TPRATLSRRRWTGPSRRPPSGAWRACWSAREEGPISVAPMGKSRVVGPGGSPAFGPAPTAPPAAFARWDAAAAHDRVPHAGPGAGDPAGRQRPGRPAVGQEPRAARVPGALARGDANPRAPHRPPLGRQAGVQGPPVPQYRAEPAARVRGR